MNTSLVPQSVVAKYTEFKPSFGLRNTHSQTILSSVGPRKTLIARRFQPYADQEQGLILECRDGVRLQSYLNLATDTPSSKVAVLIHGWEGSHESTYVQSMALTLLQGGIDVLRLNLRDHGDTHHLNEEIFNCTMLDEVLDALEFFQSKHPYPETHLVGFSLGGNFCLRAAAFGHDRPLNISSTIAFCPVLHASQSNEVLNSLANWMYGRYFVRKWKRSLKKKLAHWPEFAYGDLLDSMNSLHEMNERLVPEYTPFKDLQSYFDAYAITGDVLAKTVAPCYLHFAADDMIIPVEGVQELADNSQLDVTITDRGGHCGYINNWKWECWQDQRTLELIGAVTQNS